VLDKNCHYGKCVCTDSTKHKWTGQWVGSAHFLLETVSALRSLISFGEIQHKLVFSALTAPFSVLLLPRT
jgi:hypothetical protein